MTHQPRLKYQFFVTKADLSAQRRADTIRALRVCFPNIMPEAISLWLDGIAATFKRREFHSFMKVANVELSYLDAHRKPVCSYLVAAHEHVEYVDQIGFGFGLFPENN